jgi:hypothetical protein
MGGAGSGNNCHWWRPSKKTVVEDCLSIDASRWTREGILRAGAHRAGLWRWVYHGGRECSIGYEVLARDMDWPRVRLHYAQTVEGRQEPVDYHVCVDTTVPTFGGLRWWFLCPLIVDGLLCERRVGKLYLPPCGRYFGCRSCYRLTYTSCQANGQGKALARMVARNLGADFETVNRLLKRIGKRTR